MADPCDRYSITRDRRLLDSDPMKDGKDILVFDKASGKWVDFEGTLGEWRHSKPITAKEAARLTGGVAGYKPPKRRRAKSKTPVDDLPKTPVPPFRVDVVDQYEGHCEDGYGPAGSYDRLEDAIAEARRITEAAIKESGSYKNWDGMGDAGLVYDATGKLVWDGVKVAEAEHKQN